MTDPAFVLRAMTAGFAARAAHVQTSILTSRGFLLAIGLLLVND
jgi:hypothetical protein